MHSYHKFAAITLIANTLEILPEVGRQLPHTVIADWMEQHGIEPEDVLYAAPDEVKTKLVGLIRQGQSHIPHAAIAHPARSLIDERSDPPGRSIL